MYDEKKLEFFLDSLELSTHYPSEARRRVIAPEQSALDRKMDKYDIFKQGDYQNLGTTEFPIWGKQEFSFGFTGWMNMPIQYANPIYGGIQRASFPVQGFNDAAPAAPIETPHQKLTKKIASLESAAAAKIENPNPAPPTPSPSPDYVGTITAWRGWAVEDGFLAALGTDFEWPSKTASRARCVHEHHPAPQSQCSCGFWSFKNLELLTQAMSSYTDVAVIGTVEIWGRVIECKNGWRSEFAYPKELWLLEPGLEHLSWDYGVPVRQL